MKALYYNIVTIYIIIISIIVVCSAGRMLPWVGVWNLSIMASISNLASVSVVAIGKRIRVAVL